MMFLVQAALGIKVEIPALRVYEEICSTDFHAALARTDCSGKPDRFLAGTPTKKGWQTQKIIFNR